jgi:hypothetical protein
MSTFIPKATNSFCGFWLLWIVGSRPAPGMIHTHKQVSTILVFVDCLTDRLCGLVVRVPGYRTEMYCTSYEIRTEFMLSRRK